MDHENVSALFFAAAEKFPEKAAIIDRDDTTITFRALAGEVRAAADFYRAKGICKGDRVLVFVPMGIPLYRCVLALFHLGAVAVFLDEWVSKERLEACCRIAKCKAFIAPLKLRALALLSKEMRRIPLWLSPAINLSEPETRNQKQETRNKDTALITFTTGSTGTPKAADRTHGFLRAQFNALIDEIQPQETDIDMPVLPIVLLLNLGTGVTSVIADYNSRKPETIDTQRLWQQVIKHRVNRFIASPFVVEQLAAASFSAKPVLRFFTGGAPVFPRQAKAMLSGLPGSTVRVVYGSTEAEPISSIFADDLAANSSETGLPVGKPYRGTSVLILPVSTEAISVSSEEQLRKLSLPARQTGEIVVSGDHVLRHYIDNPEAQRLNKIFIGENVWHRTGDSGFLDENGNLFLCGRSSTLIFGKDGKLLAPFLWEDWLGALDGVSAGTIMQRSEKFIAVLAASAACDQKSVTEKVLARYPFDEVRFLDSIPRDRRHFSKVDYGKLKEQLQ
jgi:acyl-CoA synthetase (AMP-forming)/AMP-acid ligase II